MNDSAQVAIGWVGFVFLFGATLFDLLMIVVATRHGNFLAAAVWGLPLAIHAGVLPGFLLILTRG